MHAFFDAHVSHHKHLGSSFLENGQQPDDSSRINQAVVATFLCKIYTISDPLWETYLNGFDIQIAQQYTTI